MRTFDKKDIYSWSNCEEAKAYINKSGYFADNLDDLKECVNNDNFQTLFSVDLDPKTDVDSVFSITEIDYKFALFIPADKVKEVKNHKKWRPFKNIDEFLQKTKISVGTVIHVEISPDIVEWRSRYHLALLGYTTNSLIFPSPLNEITFQTLFDGVQLIEDDGTLQPFGMLDESEV